MRGRERFAPCLRSGMISRRASRLTNDAEKAIAVKASVRCTPFARCPGVCLFYVLDATTIPEILRPERMTNVLAVASDRCASRELRTRARFRRNGTINFTEAKTEEKHDDAATTRCQHSAEHRSRPLYRPGLKCFLFRTVRTGGRADVQRACLCGSRIIFETARTFHQANPLPASRATVFRNFNISQFNIYVTLQPSTLRLRATATFRGRNNAYVHSEREREREIKSRRLFPPRLQESISITRHIIIERAGFAVPRNGSAVLLSRYGAAESNSAEGRKRGTYL